ncbi:hypothetical protein C8E03_11755 [Lachnotalea glycerini]|uniref:Uncharacterized protein n=1 Tax=Lachnotalea glycerini TaxID=1763509 RepID=A0A318EMJ0_9FIRM|nr:hypothetical protein [Lachnotalea glycerini]PXV85419.1 hypothetical protein C8E03_11755 [Lachnotalea glycerini]
METTNNGVQKAQFQEINIASFNNNADVLNGHIDKIASSDIWGHVKLSDEYITSSGKAENGIGASSKAITDAYNKLNDKFKWNVVATDYGSTPIEVDLDDYSEIHIFVVNRAGDVYRSATFEITRDDINSTDRIFYDGAMFSQTSYVGVSISVSTSKVTLLNFVISGTNYKDGDTQTVIRAR